MAETNPPFGMPTPDAGRKPGALTGFFGGAKAAEEGLPATAMQSIVGEVNNASRRVRVLEDRYTNLRNKIQLIEENMLDSQKKFNQDIRAIQTDIMSIKRGISDTDNKVTTIIKELMMCAKKEEVDIIKKYLDLWEPVHFVTREQVERMINDAIEVAAIRVSQKMLSAEQSLKK